MEEEFNLFTIPSQGIHGITRSFHIVRAEAGSTTTPSACCWVVSYAEGGTHQILHEVELCALDESQRHLLIERVYDSCF